MYDGIQKSSRVRHKERGLSCLVFSALKLGSWYLEWRASLGGQCYTSYLDIAEEQCNDTEITPCSIFKMIFFDQRNHSRLRSLFYLLQLRTLSCYCPVIGDGENILAGVP